MKSFIYAQTTTTYTNLMPLPMRIRGEKIIQFTEQTNSGKHYPPKLRAVHHCNSLNINSKFGDVIHVIVRFAQDTLPKLVIFSLFFQ